MKAMILAAGYGTRLRPLTANIPKALVKVGGKTLLEWTIQKLKAVGVTSIVINLHHFAEKIETFLQENSNFDIQIELSRETEILGTGGGLIKATNFLQDVPWFIVHNVDVLSTVPLAELLEIHLKNQNLATLFMQFRNTKRYLAFDQNNLLIGRYPRKKKAYPGLRSNRKLLAFNGIHVISSEIFKYMQTPGYSSVIDYYLKCVALGKRIQACELPDIYWRDLGRLETLKAVAEDLELQRISAGELIGTTS